MIQTIAVTGASGFLGTHVVRFLKDLDRHQIVGVGRDKAKLQALGTDYVVCDLNEPKSNWYEALGRPDLLLHLAWEGLPNYRELFHIERNLLGNYRFLKNMVLQGLPRLAVAGTCYEYGLQNGCLSESQPTSPTTCYGIAKDALRRLLEALKDHTPFCLLWLRIFFLYGEGQSDKSLMSQLQAAIASGAESFDMSPGEQLRDYLPAEDAAALLLKVALQNRYEGIFNIGSGNPISIRRLVEKHLEAQNVRVLLNLGAYSYPDYEPMAYWSDVSRLNSALEAYEEEYAHE